MQRFLSKVLKTSSCWLWTGYLTNSGYGQFRYKGKTQKSHRVSYELFKGMIPDGMVVDHLCKNRRCVNPEHLEVVTQKENIRRGDSGISNNAQLKKTHCPKGHEYSRITKDGYRLCGRCRSDQTMRSRIKNKSLQ